MIYSVVRNGRLTYSRTGVYRRSAYWRGVDRWRDPQPPCTLLHGSNRIHANCTKRIALTNCCPSKRMQRWFFGWHLGWHLSEKKVFKWFTIVQLNYSSFSYWSSANTSPKCYHQRERERECWKVLNLSINKSFSDADRRTLLADPPRSIAGTFRSTTRMIRRSVY